MLNVYYSYFDFKTEKTLNSEIICDNISDVKSEILLRWKRIGYMSDINAVEIQHFDEIH